jgi:hypothetical protein
VSAFVSRRICARAFLQSFLVAGALWADAPAATVTGVIADASGGVLPGAVVEIRKIDTGVVRGTTTNAAGIYQLPGLRSGRYDLSVSEPRFAPARRTNIVLRVSDDVRIDFELQPGEQRESVVVTDAAPLTQTESSTASTVVNQESIQDLPGDGGQWQNLALIVPGVAAGWNLSTAANRYGKAREDTEGAFTVNGTRSRSNDFLFDGMPMNLRHYGVI